MLVLSRKVKESILIGSDIEVRITKIEGDSVRIGIIAPIEVPVYRKEVLEVIENNNKKALLSSEVAPLQLQTAQKWLKTLHNEIKNEPSKE